MDDGGDGSGDDDDEKEDEENQAKQSRTEVGQTDQQGTVCWLKRAWGILHLIWLFSSYTRCRPEYQTLNIWAV